jgi:hypothetical protein
MVKSCDRSAAHATTSSAALALASYRAAVSSPAGLGHGVLSGHGDELALGLALHWSGTKTLRLLFWISCNGWCRPPCGEIPAIGYLWFNECHYFNLFNWLYAWESMYWLSYYWLVYSFSDNKWSRLVELMTNLVSSGSHIRQKFIILFHGKSLIQCEFSSSWTN